MDRRLALALNKYPTVPRSLRVSPSTDVARTEITVGLADLYHHYYLDSFDIKPPDPDASKFEHVQFLMPGPEFRFQGAGVGAAPGIRRSRSTELGQAFCRWFLHEHHAVRHYAHVETIIDRQAHRPFDGFRVERVTNGDGPDYLCAARTGVCLAEAKGSYRAVGFGTKTFSSWRKQFSRVRVLDGKKVVRSIKGYIVATRYATEHDSARIRSTIHAEDPDSPGEVPIDDATGGHLAQAVRALHYANVAGKLRQPVLAAALSSGSPIPEELRILAVAWRLMAGPLAGRRFIGGYFAPIGDDDLFENGAVKWPPRSPLRLDQPHYTFFGLEETIFRDVVAMARSGTYDYSIASLDELQFFYSGFSVLGDGTAMGPVDFLQPVETVAL